MSELNHPFLDRSFAIRWSELSAKQVVADMRVALEQGNLLLRCIEGLPQGKETYANTFQALAEAVEAVSLPWSKVSVLDSTCDNKELRHARTEVLPAVSDFFAAIPLNVKIYERLKTFAASSALAELAPIQQRYVSETLKDFEEAGANLADETRQRLQAIESRLAEITKKFAENVLDSLNAFEKIIDDVAALSGLPESHIEAARLSALNKGYGTEAQPMYRITLQAPSYIPVMRFADNAALRQELTEAYCRVGHYGDFENEGLIQEILRLRAEKAGLLGRKHFPDLVIARRMAKDGQTALAFVEELHAHTRPAFDEENADLITFKSQQTGEPEQPLAPWDFAYWSEKLRKQRFDFDEEELRPYFPVQSVMHGMFAIVERIFGISVSEIADPKPDTWHPEVTYYEVRDKDSGRHLGSFYADWFPRESKRGGAWMGEILSGKPDPDGKLSPHLGYICGNMTPPVGDKPALLSHNDVLTIFHEFGHLLHLVLSEVPIPALAGTNVAWDFVELPSQLMENWAWDREGLNLFARHYETQEPIPDELFAKMLRARNFGEARMQMRQLAFGKMDLELHLNFNPDGTRDMDDFIEDILADYQPPRSIKLPSTIRSFNHLFSHATGYASGYYSYKWAEVLDADAFTRFSAEGVFNPQTGRAFRQHILAKGNSEEPQVLFRNFMQRDPDPKALLRRSGLLRE